jgi:hypothetical protein
MKVRCSKCIRVHFLVNGLAPIRRGPSQPKGHPARASVVEALKSRSTASSRESVVPCVREDLRRKSLSGGKDGHFGECWVFMKTLRPPRRAEPGLTVAAAIRLLRGTALRYRIPAPKPSGPRADVSLRIASELAWNDAEPAAEPPVGSVKPVDSGPKCGATGTDADMGSPCGG